MVGIEYCKFIFREVFIDVPVVFARNFSFYSSNTGVLNPLVSTAHLRRHCSPHHPPHSTATPYSLLYTLQSTLSTIYNLHILVYTTLQQDLFSVLFLSYFSIVVPGLPLPPEIAQITPFWVITPLLRTPTLILFT